MKNKLRIVIVSILGFLVSVTNIRAAAAIPIPSNGVYYGALASAANGSGSDDTKNAFIALTGKKLGIIPLTVMDQVNFTSNCTKYSWCQSALIKDILENFNAYPLITIQTNNRTLAEISTNTINPRDKRPNQTNLDKLPQLPDDFFRSWAQGLKAIGKPVFLRFDHEMNSTLYPWGACGNSCKDPDTGSPQTPAQYVKAWKHVHDIFIAEGATNVVWVWCPYGNAVSVNSFAPYYPGNDYVDWVAIDVYNWGSSSLYSLTKTSYDVLGSITGNSKPIMLAEFNSVNNESSGYRKAAWITAAFGNDIPSLPNIKAVVWFNHDYLSPGLRIETKPYDTYVVPAYKKAIASSYYLPNNSATVTPTPTPIPGDYTDVGDVPGDEVNIFDYNLVVSNFGNPYTIFDYNNVVQYFNL